MESTSSRTVLPDTGIPQSARWHTGQGPGYLTSALDKKGLSSHSRYHLAVWRLKTPSLPWHHHYSCLVLADREFPSKASRYNAQDVVSRIPISNWRTRRTAPSDLRYLGHTDY